MRLTPPQIRCAAPRGRRLRHAAAACGRTGATLVATLVAILLGAAAMVLVARGTAHALAIQARLVTGERTRDDPADALDAIAARLRHVAPHAGDLLAADSATLALRTTVGVALLCGRLGDTLLLARGADGAAWASDWLREPAAGDELRAAASTDSTAPTVPLRAVRTGAGPCAPGVRAWSERVTWRAVVADTTGVVPALAVGDGVRLLARERWLAYAGAGGARTLGLAAWDVAAGTWAAPQPVVAPIASAGQGGLVVAALDAAGAPLPAASLAQARHVVVALRAIGADAADSIVVPLHGH